MSKLKTILFWAASCTWGAIMTLIGAITGLILICLGYKPQKFHNSIFFEVGESWGGLSLGAFFFVCKRSGVDTKRHERGHCMQNALFGIFFPFLIGIPSAIRYWYREIVVKLGIRTYADLPDYDAIWFEKQATELGDKYFT